MGTSSNAALLAAAAIVLGAVVVLVALLRRLIGPAGLPYYSRETLLSKGEAAFFPVLRKAAPAGLIVAPKVRLGDIIACNREAWREGFGGKISQKHVDFVLIDAVTTAFVLAVELDDRSHARRDRQQRDSFVDRALAAAGIPILHEPAAANYDWTRLRIRLVSAIREMEIAANHAKK